MEGFHKVYIDFLKHLKHAYPELDVHLSSFHKKDLLQQFVQYILPYIEDISIKNLDAFKYKHDNFIVKNVEFRKLLKLAEKRESLDSIWRYLQTIYIEAYNTGLLDTAIASSQKLKDILANHKVWMQNMVSSNNIKADDSESDISSSDDGDNNADNDVNKKEDDSKKNDAKKEKDDAKKEKEEDGKNPFAGTALGKLAEELADEIPKEDLELFKDVKSFSDIQQKFTSEDGGKKFGQMFNLVSKKFESKIKNGEIDQQKLMQETGQLLMKNMMGGGGGDGSNMMQEMMKSMMGGGNKSKKKSKKGRGKKRR